MMTDEEFEVLQTIKRAINSISFMVSVWFTLWVLGGIFKVIFYVLSYSA